MPARQACEREAALDDGGECSGAPGGERLCYGFMSDVSSILEAAAGGDPRAAERLLPLVYDELRKLAAAKLTHEHPGQTLQATALVHEAYLRLLGPAGDSYWDSRGHFFAAAAEAMRRILVENARRKRSLKAGGEMIRVDLEQASLVIDPNPDDLLALEEALTKLAAEDSIAAELAQLRLFAGLTVDDAAKFLGLSRSTGFRHWTYARRSGN
jgi:RNA polymerase sigma factor (TIGR02999 family)